MDGSGAMDAVEGLLQAVLLFEDTSLPYYFTHEARVRDRTILCLM